MGSSEEPRDPEESDQRQQDHLSPVHGDGPLDAVPESNAMTPEGYIEGIGSFAQGLKRMIRRWRHK